MRPNRPHNNPGNPQSTIKTSVSILLTLVVFATTTVAKPIADVGAMVAGNTQFTLKLY
ncbi:MAG: hypothetical protein O3A82_12260 [Verrucomicrobia bacterium]|nr:hypothetical protein [Verrucomicrobiota bacterium]MDA0724374.1 hypothetical protein [Verrucomicrobiota bacterium]MDA1047692.1 hypothetical protein [Verrucomicrobiota bacterium]